MTGSQAVAVAEVSGLAFGVLLATYTLVGGIRLAFGEGRGWQRLAIIGGSFVVAPFAYGAGWVIGIWLWPVALLIAGGLVIAPFRLLTRRGRRDLAYTMRWGRWKDRPK